MSEETATPTARTIRLGPIEGQIMMGLIAEYQRTSRPIPYNMRDKIVARHAKTAGAVMMALLRGKGALKSDQGKDVKEKDCIPLLAGVVYVESKNGKRLWPPERKEEKPVGDPDKSPKTRKALQDPDYVANDQGAFVVPSSAKPAVLSPDKARIYKALMVVSRNERYMELPHAVLMVLVRQEAPSVRSPTSMLFDLTYKDGCLVVQGMRGKNNSNPSARQVVFRPYKVMSSSRCRSPRSIAEATVIIPPECSAQSVDIQVEVQAPEPTVAIPVSGRLRSREEIQAEVAQLERRAGEIMDAAKEERLKPLKMRLAQVDEQAKELSAKLLELDGQRKELVGEIKKIEDPRLTHLQGFTIPQDALDLLASAGRKREALSRYDELLRENELLKELFDS